MINLGDGPYKEEAANQQIAELNEAGIPARIVATEVIKITGSDVATFKIVGRLYGWEFSRAWYYWMAKCINPSAQIRNPDAMKLWVDHGRQLRVYGHCGCVKPEPPWLASRFNIKEVDGQENNLLTEKLYEIYHDDLKLATVPLNEVDRQIEIFKMDMEEDEAHGGVDSYHVDTQEALNAFTQYLLNRKS